MLLSSAQPDRASAQLNTDGLIRPRTAALLLGKVPRSISSLMDSKKNATGVVKRRRNFCQGKSAFRDDYFPFWKSISAGGRPWRRQWAK